MRNRAGRTNLYRHYSSSGELLYIGISLSAIARLKDHKTHALWFDEIRRIEITQYTSRTDACLAERLAIYRERPKHNIVGKVDQAKTEKLLRFLKDYG